MPDETNEVPVPNVQLHSGSFYVLSYQVANMDWIQPTATNEGQTGPFLTSDGRFRIFGSCNPAIGPCNLLTPVWSVGTSPGGGKKN